MDKAGFALGPSAPGASANSRVLADACPDRHTQLPVIFDRFYVIAVDAIEKDGGPLLIDRLVPAEWLIERALKARWPRCVDVARPYLSKTRKAGT
jgi:hypothetical protein